MFSDFPKSVKKSLGWTWEDFFPFFDDLLNRELTQDNIHLWLVDWTLLQNFYDEIQSYYYRLISQNTNNTNNIENHQKFSDSVVKNFYIFDHQLKEKLLDSELIPNNFKIPLRNMKNAISIYRKENELIKLEIDELIYQYHQLIGNRSISTPEGEIPIKEFDLNLYDHNRDIRENAWRKKQERFLKDREEINVIWSKLIKLQTELAKNAGFENFSQYQLCHLTNDDINQNDLDEMLQSFSDFIFPAANRTNRRRQENLNIDSLRPWDLGKTFRTKVSLKPIDSVEELYLKTKKILLKVHPQFAVYYQSMIDNNMMDLTNRPNKFKETFDIDFPLSGFPFLSQNVVNDNLSLTAHLHEVGHAIHFFEKKNLPYCQQRKTNLGIEEAIAISLQLIFLNYLETEENGFYSKKDATLSKIRFLEKTLRSCLASCISDSFLVWAFENPDQSIHSENCDAYWSELTDKYLPEVNYEGFETEKSIGWQSISYIFDKPYYYSEHSLGFISALNIWENYSENPNETISTLRHGMSLGETLTRRNQIFAIGSKLNIDGKSMLKNAALVMRTIMKLESEL